VLKAEALAYGLSFQPAYTLLLSYRALALLSGTQYKHVFPPKTKCIAEINWDWRIFENKQYPRPYSEDVCVSAFSHV
jgi:hypothetical protein